MAAAVPAAAACEFMVEIEVEALGALLSPSSESAGAERVSFGRAGEAFTAFTGAGALSAITLMRTFMVRPLAAAHAAFKCSILVSSCFWKYSFRTPSTRSALSRVTGNA